MHVHPDSESELTPLQIQEAMEQNEVGVPVMAYKVVGGNVELHLLGGTIARVPHPDTDLADDLNQDLSTLTVKQLRILARDQAIDGYSKMKKSELIQELKEKTIG